MAAAGSFRFSNRDIFGDSEPNPNSPPETLPESRPQPLTEFSLGSDPLAAANGNEGRELIEEMMRQRGVTGEGGVGNLPDSGSSLPQSDAPSPDLFAQANAANEPVVSGEYPGKSASTPVVEKGGYELAVVATPDWLPPGWRTEIKIRNSGATAGTRDRYFYDPVSHRKFRSKKEVFSFLKTGTLGRYKPKPKVDESDANSTEKGIGPGHRSNSRKRASSSSRQKSPLRFDFVNRPAKVRWVLDGPDGSWSPFVGDVELPESSKRTWAAALELHRSVFNAFQE